MYTYTSPATPRYMKNRDNLYPWIGEHCRMMNFPQHNIQARYKTLVHPGGADWWSTIGIWQLQCLGIRNNAAELTVLSCEGHAPSLLRPFPPVAAAATARSVCLRSPRPRMSCVHCPCVHFNKISERLLPSLYPRTSLKVNKIPTTIKPNVEQIRKHTERLGGRGGEIRRCCTHRFRVSSGFGEWSSEAVVNKITAIYFRAYILHSATQCTCSERIQYISPPRDTEPLTRNPTRLRWGPFLVANVLSASWKF